MNTASAPHRLDAVGIGLSALCLLHCLALPLVATGALAWAASERVHIGLTVVLAVVVLLVAVPGFRRHRRAVVPALLVLGLVSLVGALAWGPGMGETALTTFGSVALVAGHTLNLRLPHACPRS